MKIYFSKNKTKTTTKYNLTKGILSSMWQPIQIESSIENTDLSELVLIGAQKFEDRNTDKYEKKVVLFVQ